jgi:hypothetical protein
MGNIVMFPHPFEENLKMHTSRTPKAHPGSGQQRKLQHQAAGCNTPFQEMAGR